VLGAQLERGPARGQDLDARAAGQHLVEVRCYRDEPLQVVEHEQDGCVTEVLDERVQRRLRAGDVCSYRAGDVDQRLLGCGNRRERHEHCAPRVVIVETFPHRDGQACLADPSGSGQADQPRLGALEQPVDVLDGLFSADERGGVHR
jgi:hypothetical protein